MNQSLEFRALSQYQGQDPSARILFQNITDRWTGPSVQVLMGSSGCGKSTFIKSLAGVWRPSSGEVLFGGKNLWNQNDENQNMPILSKIGFSFQNNALFTSMRVIENLTFPYAQRFPESKKEDRIILAKKWLKNVELQSSSDVYPHELSGGMQKRLGIARTLILNPEYIFLDDPTAGLDPITSKVMAKLVKDLLKDSSALVIINCNK